MRRSWRSLVGSLIVPATLLSLSACYVETPRRVVVVAPNPPPPVRVETVPAVPAPRAEALVWDPGHWHWDGHDWVWRPGHYVERPRREAVWEPGHWVAQPAGGYLWVDGHWR